MKKLLLLLTLLTSFFVQAQTSGGPDAFGYVWRDDADTAGPSYNWIDITSFPNAVVVTGLTDDNTSSFYPIGFQFPYYWYTVSQFKVGSNGYLIFNNGQIASPFPHIPSSALPQDYVGAFMSDLNFIGAGNTAQCIYWTNNTDTLIVSFIDVPFWVNATPPYTGANTFQIILSAVDSSITYQYAQQQGASAAATNFLSIGMENNSGTIGLEQSFDVYPFVPKAIKFYYPPSSSFVVEDAAVAYNDNPETGGIFLSKDGNPYTLTTRIKNTGNQAINPFDVYIQLFNSFGSQLQSETLMTSALNPGQTEDLTTSNPFSPVTEDTYSLYASATLPGDATPTNNEKVLEVRVVDTTQSFMTLGYCGAIPSPAGSGVSWSGGDAGMGIEIRPPFYPIYARRLEFYITTNASLVGFYALIFDNTGPNNTPGNLLDSVYVPGTSVMTNSWNTVSLNSAIQIDSGSVFIAWMMDGASITLGTDDTPPVGNRSYEILGSWSIYRNREDRDPMIRMITSIDPTTGVTNPVKNDIIGQFYPSPSGSTVNIQMDLMKSTNRITYDFYNLEGQLVDSREISTSESTYYLNQTLDIARFNAGVYVCKITVGNREYNRKLIVSN